MGGDGCVVRALDCINLGTTWLFAISRNRYKEKLRPLKKGFCDGATYRN